MTGWLFFFGGNGGGLCDLKHNKTELLVDTCLGVVLKALKKIYLLGNGGFGGGLESLNIFSVLYEACIGFDVVFSSISRSLEGKKER